ncbi:MAG: family 43 glycosylhydrolase [Bacteroidaceae bacterium]|nr:family 43 glycosylhydrolase [Bacteroidaceae bacterium]
MILSRHRLFTCLLLWVAALALTPLSAQHRIPEFRTGVPTDSIILSDPCILADSASKTYYMTGTGGLLWTSTDLRTWDGPRQFLEFDTASWMGHHPQIWAAELHQYKGRYYCFATFTNREITIDSTANGRIPRRATHVLVSDKPDGPYRPAGNQIYLPAHEATLDGTLWVDNDDNPYMVYCHEWLQTGDGTIEMMRLTDDLSGSLYSSRLLFRASDSPWSIDSKADAATVAPTRHQRGDGTWPNVVTDGPWLFRTQNGRLGLFWTSWRDDVYTTGVAYSVTGTLLGPWVHETEPLLPPNYGHGMLFHDFRGMLVMSVHSHSEENGHYVRHPHFFLMNDEGNRLVTLAHFKP